MQGNALGRHAVQFQWQDVLLVEGPSTAADTVYEMASVFTAIAVLKQRRAVYLCQGSKTGTSSDAAIKVHMVCMTHVACQNTLLCANILASSAYW